MPVGSFFYVIRNNPDGSVAVDFYADKEAANLAREIEDKKGTALPGAGPLQIELEFGRDGQLLTPDATAAELKDQLAQLQREQMSNPKPVAPAFNEVVQPAAPVRERAPQPSVLDRIGSVAGKTIVFTGKMEGNRHRLQDDAAALGATVGNMVNESTDILVVGEDRGSSKLDRARELGITILNERQWNDLARRTAAQAASAKPKSGPTP